MKVKRYVLCYVQVNWLSFHKCLVVDAVVHKDNGIGSGIVIYGYDNYFHKLSSWIYCNNSVDT